MVEFTKFCQYFLTRKVFIVFLFVFALFFLGNLSEVWAGCGGYEDKICTCRADDYCTTPMTVRIAPCCDNEDRFIRYEDCGWAAGCTCVQTNQCAGGGGGGNLTRILATFTVDGGWVRERDFPQTSCASAPRLPDLYFTEVKVNGGNPNGDRSYNCSTKPETNLRHESTDTTPKNWLVKINLPQGYGCSWRYRRWNEPAGTFSQRGTNCQNVNLTNIPVNDRQSLLFDLTSRPTPRPTPSPTPRPTPTLQPSCTVSLSPSTLTLYRGESRCCIVARVNVQGGTVSQISFTSINPAVASLTSGGSRYSTEVNGHRTGQTQVLAQVTLSPNGECRSLPVLVAVAERTPGWFQTKEGDVHAGGEIQVDIPTTAVNRNFSLAVLGGFPGVVSYGQNAHFGDGYPSASGNNHWLAQSSALRKPFSYFYSLVDSPSPNYSGPYLPSESGVYFANSDIAISSSGSLPAGKKVVILVDGSINITTDIDVPKGSFLFIAAKQDITVVDPTVSQIEGIFLTDGAIIIGQDNSQFRGEGSFIAGSLILGRDLRDANATTPAEKFTYRPDFFINSHLSLWSSYHTWEELAP